MNSIRKHLLATAAGVVLATGGISAAFAAPLIANPSNTNNGVGALDSSVGAFTADSSQMNFSADLIIQSQPAAGGPVASSEYGSFLFTDFKLGNTVQTSGLGTYNIYGTFLIQGTGSWSGPLYSLSSLTDALITLYAEPTGGTTPTQVTPSQGNPGIEGHAGDLDLGTFSFGNVGLAEALFAGAGSFTVFDSALVPNLNSDFTGADGFFQNVIGNGLNLTINSSDSSTGTDVTASIVANGTDGCTQSGGCTDFLTNWTGANGSITYDVPEPASLALLGGGLLGLGVLRRRKSRKA